jgi:D-Tyr-tRNAtyr deacylase
MLHNKVEEELNQANDSHDTKKDYTQQKIAKLRTVLKDRKGKQVDSILEVQTDSLFVKKYVIMAVERRSESRN